MHFGVFDTQFHHSFSDHIRLTKDVKLSIIRRQVWKKIRNDELLPVCSPEQWNLQTVEGCKSVTIRYLESFCSLKWQEVVILLL